MAGNRAVAALIARAPKAKPKPKPPAETPAPAQPKDSHVIVPGVGTIPVESFSWGTRAREGPSEGKASFTDLHLSSEVGDHSAAVMLAVTDGTRFETIELVLMKEGTPYLRVKLHKAYITSYQIGGGGTGRAKPVETWSIDAESVEWEKVPASTDFERGY